MILQVSWKLLSVYHFPNSLISPHISVPLTQIKGRRTTTVLWEILWMTQQTRLGILNTPFYLCPCESFSLIFSRIHLLRNLLVALPKSLPHCSIHMPSCFISCYCCPEVTAALRGWKQCFEVPPYLGCPVLSHHAQIPGILK